MYPVYCIECGKMVMVESGKYGLVHEHSYFTGYVYEYDWCELPMGYAMCEPPEMPEDWEIYVSEPTEEELELMDESAIEILESI